LPAIKYHCGVLAVGALRRAIRTYYKNREKPVWLPQDLTPEERQVLEEEELMKILARKVGLIEKEDSGS